MNPLISIVLCTYNGERFLKEQIDSLLRQTWPALEIIISDDCSTDATKEILSAYKEHPFIKLFFQEVNLGPVENFEFAVRKTSGELIAFSDQDDIWKADKLEKLYRFISNEKLVYCDSELIDEKGKALHKKLSDLRNMYSGTNTKGFVFDNVVWGHAMLVHNSLLPIALPIPQGIPHDIWFGYIATANGGIKYLDEPLTFYRQHSGTYTITIAIPASSRPHNKRYEDYKKQLHWIGVMKEHSRIDEQPFYDRLYILYSLKEKGKFVWPLFFFLYRYRSDIFLFRKKSAASNFIEIIKQCRGEGNGKFKM